MHIGELLDLQKKDPILRENKARNEKEDILEQFVKQINLERIGTRYKPITFMGVKMKLRTLKTTHELYSFYQDCLRYKNRPQGNGSFSKCFFGATSTKPKKNEEKSMD